MKSIYAFIGAPMALTSTPALAAALMCTTTVSELQVTPAGNVYPTFSGSGTPNMCNLNMTITGPGVGTISPDVCKTWIAMFLTAKFNQAPMTIKIEYGSGTPPTSCANIPNFDYQIPNPFPYWVSNAP